MPMPPNPPGKELANTYFVQDASIDKELIRLTIQDKILTTGMGGVLSEQKDPTTFHTVLDVACGSGSWLIEAAKTYPSMSRLVGIDINKRMVEYARMQAETVQGAERVKFRVMDALRILEFPAYTFDLVNTRLCMGFLRTWEWPKFVSEMFRVTRPGGIVRLTEAEIVVQSNSPALTRLGEMAQCALYKASHFFTNESAGLNKHLAEQLFLRGYGCQDIQTKAYALEYQAETAETHALYEDVKYGYLVVRPFIEKMGCASKDYEAIYQQALDEMQQPDFHGIWNTLTAWGSKPKAKAK